MVQKAKASLKAMPGRDPTCNFEPIWQCRTVGRRTFLPQKHRAPRAGENHPSAAAKLPSLHPCPSCKQAFGPCCVSHSTTPAALASAPVLWHLPVVPSGHLGSSSLAHSRRAHSLSKNEKSGSRFNLESLKSQTCCWHHPLPSTSTLPQGRRENLLF